MPMAEAAAQILLMALLVATIVWCVLVHRRLGRLRADGGELAAIIAALDAATARAGAVVGELRVVTTEASGRLAERDGAAQRHEAELGRLDRDGRTRGSAGSRAASARASARWPRRAPGRTFHRRRAGARPSGCPGRPARRDKAEAILEALRGLR